MKKRKKSQNVIVCLPFCGVTPFHKKIENHYLKADSKTNGFPSMGGFKFH